MRIATFVNTSFVLLMSASFALVGCDDIELAKSDTPSTRGAEEIAPGGGAGEVAAVAAHPAAGTYITIGQAEKEETAGEPDQFVETFDAGQKMGAPQGNPSSPSQSDLNPAQSVQGQVQCTEICGDVNNDGEVDTQDLLALQAAVLAKGGVIYTHKSMAAAACMWNQADTNLDQALNVLDITKISAFINGQLDEELTCPASDEEEDEAPVTCTDLCGDANNDGVVTSEDAEFLSETILAGGDAGCAASQADINADGKLNVLDVTAIVAFTNDEVDGLFCSAPVETDEAESCSAICGDVNQDGEVSAEDATLLGAVILGQEESDACDAIHGDANGDGFINVADVVALTAYVNGHVANLNCAN